MEGQIIVFYIGFPNLNFPALLSEAQHLFTPSYRLLENEPLATIIKLHQITKLKLM